MKERRLKVADRVVPTVKTVETMKMPAATLHTAISYSRHFCEVIFIGCILVLYFLGQLSRPDICNQLSIINYQPGDSIMAAKSLAKAVAFGTRKTGIKHIQTI